MMLVYISLSITDHLIEVLKNRITVAVRCYLACVRTESRNW